MATILIVDDDAMTLRLVEQTISSGGHTAIPTTDAVNAARVAAQRSVDAVILDVMMPGRSGFGVLEDIRKNPEIAAVPVLMLSLRSHAADRVRGLRHGADEYVCKPFDPEELLLRLDKLLVERTPDEALFRGRLETVTLPEVIQSLLHGAREGVLEVWAPTGRGRLVLAAGCVRSAVFGRLSGIDAVLAMLDVSSGTFKFRDEASSDSEDVQADTAVPLEPVIFASAWLDDEMRRWPAVAPDQGLYPAMPERDSVAVMPGYESLPFGKIWRAVVKDPGLRLGELVDRQLAAPRRVELVVRLLVNAGEVELRSGPRAGSPQSGEEEKTGPGIAESVDRLVRTAAARGFTSDNVPILLLVEPTVRPALVGFLEFLPESVRVPPSQSSRVILSAGRLAEFSTSDGEVSLAVHVASLASEVVLERVWSGIESYAGVIVWIESDLLSQEVEWIVDRLEQLSTPQWGLLLASGDAAATSCERAIRRSARWKLQVDRPTSLMRILDQLASAGTVVALG